MSVHIVMVAKKDVKGFAKVLQILPVKMFHNRTGWIPNKGPNYMGPQQRFPNPPGLSRGYPPRRGFPRVIGTAPFHRIPVSQPNDMPPPPTSMGPPLRQLGPLQLARGPMYPQYVNRGGANHMMHLQRGGFQPPIWTPNRVTSGNIPTRPNFKRGNPNMRRRLRVSRSSKRVKPETHQETPSGVDPSDPLNLSSLIKESEMRASRGEPPRPGDSTFNTPCVSEAGDSVPTINAENSISAQPSKRKSDGAVQRGSKRSKIDRYYPNWQNRSGRGVGYRKRNQRGRAPRGNYKNYYNSRPDPLDRLNAMLDWFSGKDVMDYGCNSGYLTISLFEKFPDIRRLDAMDSDEQLIKNAKHLLREKGRLEDFRVEVAAPQVDRIEPHDRSRERLDYGRIFFQVGDWVSDRSPEEADSPQYDVILAFSVTKWIHLNHGDVGLLKFFRRCFNRLRPGGHLMIEPQQRDSYKRCVKEPVQIENLKNMRIEPAHLEPVLADLGFCYFEPIYVPKPGQPYKRVITMCTKSNGFTPLHIRDSFVQRAHGMPSDQHTGGNVNDDDYVVPVPNPPPVDYNYHDTPRNLETDPFYSPSQQPNSSITTISTSADRHRDVAVVTSTTSELPEHRPPPVVPSPNQLLDVSTEEVVSSLVDEEEEKKSKIGAEVFDYLTSLSSVISSSPQPGPSAVHTDVVVDDNPLQEESGVPSDNA